MAKHIQERRQFIVARTNGKTIKFVTEANKFTDAVHLMKLDVIAEAEKWGIQIIEQDLCKSYSDIGASTDTAWLNIDKTRLLWQVMKIH